MGHTQNSDDLQTITRGVGWFDGLLRVCVFFDQYSVPERPCLGQISVFVEEVMDTVL